MNGAVCKVHVYCLFVQILVKRTTFHRISRPEQPCSQEGSLKDRNLCYAKCKDRAFLAKYNCTTSIYLECGNYSSHPSLCSAQNWFGDVDENCTEFCGLLSPQPCSQTVWDYQVTFMTYITLTTHIFNS